MSLLWVMERVHRCESQIWATASHICANRGSVVLDLGFTKIERRTHFRSLAEHIGAPVQLHIIDAPYAIRKARVIRRNAEKGDTYSFEVAPMMFDFMEQAFESPTDDERQAAILVEQG